MQLGDWHWKHYYLVNIFDMKILLPSILLVFLIALWQIKIFTIKTIDTQLDRASCTNDQKIKEAAEIFGQNFFLINKDSVEMLLKEKFSCIKAVNLKRAFPNKVKMTILGREVAAILLPLKDEKASAATFLENIATPSASEVSTSFLIDNEGVVFADETSKLNWPKIFANISNVSLGQRLEKVVASLKIMGKVKTYGLDADTFLVLDNFFVIFSDPKVIFKLDETIEEQLASLQLILEKAKIDASQLEFIDLRFEKPVVRFAPKKNG